MRSNVPSILQFPSDFLIGLVIGIVGDILLKNAGTDRTEAKKVLDRVTQMTIIVKNVGLFWVGLADLQDIA